MTGVGVAATAGLYTWQVEPHWLELTSGTLPISHLPDSLHGCRMAHISDMHVGHRVDDSYLIECFRAVNALAPDLVVYTGDFTSYDDAIFEHARTMLSHFPHGSRGTFGILGNHDYGPNWSHPEVAERIAALASSSGIRVLRNELIDFNGLQIVGFDDLWAGKFDPKVALANYRVGQAALALSHNPDTVDLDGWGQYAGWILAGHTHGGQCKPPFLPPPLLPVKNRRYTCGAFELENSRNMYISRGVGHLTKVRFNVRPEITIFTLVRA